MTAASARQIGAIHAAAKRLGLDDGCYRDLIEAETGQRTAKGLSARQAWRVLERMKDLGGTAAARPAAAAADGAQHLEGDYAGVCRSLWIAGYNLGVFADRTDRALVAFARRQTGIDHLNWVREGKSAAKVIEALKGWIARDTGVTWDADKELLRTHGLTLARWRKLEVIRAQIRRLADLGEHEAPSRAVLSDADDAGLDAISAGLGRRLRKALGRRSA